LSGVLEQLDGEVDGRAALAGVDVSPTRRSGFEVENALA
jgi:hypothetical protein